MRVFDIYTASHTVQFFTCNAAHYHGLAQERINASSPTFGVQLFFFVGQETLSP